LVDLDALAALDGLQWLRTGEEVCKRTGFSPASVSRQSRKCLDLFALELRRIDGEWSTIGDTSLLQHERRVHQTARWLGRRPLRLEATYWSGPLLCSPVPEGWMLGVCNIVGVARNLQLVRERIVDACLLGLPDLPDENDAELTAIRLSSMPVFFVCSPDHPIRNKCSLRYADIANYPTLGLPEGSYPRVEQALQSIGLWNDCVRMNRYKRELWEGKSEDELTIGYGTVLSLEVSGGNLVRLPLELPFCSGEALVVRRDLATHPRCLGLIALISQRLQAFCQRYPELALEPLQD
jgi:DNA-binding transcriptional LysR family regulator